MARIQSKAKAGFFPTPDSVIELIKKKLTFEPGARLFDSCCGEGKSLSGIAKGSETETFGIELSYQRYQAARLRLDTVLWADSLHEIKITPKSMGLIYLNPPYDIDNQGISRRLETTFLRRHWYYLQRGGYLLYVVPFSVLKDSAKKLSRSFQDLKVFSFPEDEFDAFKQCVVLGRSGLVNKDKALQLEKELNHVANMEPDEFLENAPSLESMEEIVIPAPKSELKMFSTSRVDPVLVGNLVKKAGFLKRKLTELTPQPLGSIRPLAPLENGHLCLMLAGGYMNGEIEKDGKSLVIKGSIIKVEEVVSDDRERNTVTTKDKYIPTVVAIDMSKGELIHIK